MSHFTKILGLRRIAWAFLFASLAAGPAASPQTPARPQDIISDNLDHVAASAEQILEVVNKDSGLMVELKRLLARDAGASGQLLAETDLTDAAVGERLRSDLHARVLVTRLLQRYGYLVAHVNPESDLAIEQRLLLQDRVQTLTRGKVPPSDENAVPEDRELLPGGLNSPRRTPQRPSRLQQTTDLPPSDLIPADETTPSLDQPLEQTPSLGSPETLFASARKGEGSKLKDSLRGSGSVSEDNTVSLLGAQSDPQLLPQTEQPSLDSNLLGAEDSYASGDSLSSLAGAQQDLQLLSSLRTDRSSPERRMSRPGGTFERPRAKRSTASSDLLAMEPVRMLRRPNPYADLPSLYDLYVQASPNAKPLERFGLDVFRNGEANPDYLPMDLPVGPNYVLGPGDSLSIDLWGGVSRRLFRTVDREGRVVLPEAGPVLVSGRTLGDVQQDVQRVLRTQFRDISADVSLQRLRTVRVYVVGGVTSAGAYDVSSLSTPLNALFAAGGVTPQGSLRRLQHYRGKQLVEEVDAYDLLLHGIRGDLQRLENGDSLLVPSLGPTVTVEGMVRRPALYELRSEKTLEDALDLAGGILPAAALRHIEVQRLVAHDKRTMMSLEISETTDSEAIRSQLRAFALQDGDEIHVFPIAPYNTAAVYLQGHVLRPGRYSYKGGMKLTDVVTSYNDLLPEPAGNYAEIIRLHAPDYRPVVESFDLTAALEHPETAPKLEPLDTVRIFGRYDFEPAPDLLVTGEVRVPGRYRTSGQEHFRDAIFQAGGLTPDALLDSGQLFRTMPDGTTRVFHISLREALAGDPLNNILIEPRDRILIHRQPEKADPPSVYVRGEVARPGRYPFTAKMHVADLVRSAGGLLRSANPESDDLTHYPVSGNSSETPEPAKHQTLSLAAALAGNEDENPALHDGDVLTVPQQSGWNDVGAVVSLNGEVRKPGVYGIRPGEHLSSLLKRAGGLLPTAYPRAAVFERTEVLELQKKNRQDMIERLEQEATLVKTSATTTGTEEAALQQAALQQRQRMLEGLRKAPLSGRMVIHLRSDLKKFDGTPDDIELRAGDSLTIPKQPGAVTVVGQVYNANALTYSPGKNAGWYLSRAGGPTQLAKKNAIFIIRADGSITSGQESGIWSKGVLSAPIGPGDTVVVPEKPILGSTTWRNIVAIAQIAQAGALAAAVAIP